MSQKKLCSCQMGVTEFVHSNMTMTKLTWLENQIWKKCDLLSLSLCDGWIPYSTFVKHHPFTNGIHDSSFNLSRFTSFDILHMYTTFHPVTFVIFSQ